MVVKRNSHKKTKKSNKRLCFIIIGILFVCTVCGTVFILKTQSDTQSNNTSNTEENETANEISSTSELTEKESATEEETEEEEEVDTEPEKKAKQYEGDEDPNSSETLTGDITNDEVSGDTLRVRVSIDQYLTSGTCELTLTSGSKTYTDTANIIPDASTSTCEGFDIPVSKLSSGDWNIKIQLSSNNKTGLITGRTSI